MPVSTAAVMQERSVPIPVYVCVYVCMIMYVCMYVRKERANTCVCTLYVRKERANTCVCTHTPKLEKIATERSFWGSFALVCSSSDGIETKYTKYTFKNIETNTYHAETRHACMHVRVHIPKLEKMATGRSFWGSLHSAAPAVTASNPM
jgi:hypothetical protein